MACIFDEPLEPYICEADWNCVKCPNWENDTDNEYYFMACEYMAKTELFDRGLTSCRSPYDNTEAFIHQPYLRRSSNEYAVTLKKHYTELLGGTWLPIQREINKFDRYTAQKWIDEYNRLRKHGDTDGKE